MPSFDEDIVSMQRVFFLILMLVLDGPSVEEGIDGPTLGVLQETPPDLPNFRLIYLV